jgi:hypothetical protein
MQKKYKLIFSFLICIHTVLLILTLSEKLNVFFNDASLRKGKAADFFAIYQAGNNILQRESLYLDTEGVSTPYSFPFRYLPFPGYTLGVFFNLFSPFSAYYLLILLYEIILGINIYLTWKLSKKTQVFILACIPWLVFSPYLIEMFMGQWTFLVSSILFYTIYGLINKSKMINFFILAPIVKPNALIIAPLLLKYRKYKTLILTGLATLLSSIPYFIVFQDDISTFMQNFSDSWYSHGGNLGLKSLYYLVAIKYLSIPLPRLWFLMFMSATGLLVLYLTFKFKDKVLSFSLWLCYYFLIYKDVWEHHFVLLMPIYALIIVQFQMNVRKLISKKNILLLLSFLLIASPSLFIFQYLIVDSAPVEPDSLSSLFVLPYHSLKILGVILLFVWSIVQVAKDNSKIIN